MEKYNQTPSWLFEPWVNLSEICRRLYGESHRRRSGHFSQKRQGDRPWQVQELQQLEEIRQDLTKSLQESR